MLSCAEACIPCCAVCVVLQVLVDLGLLTQPELEGAIVSEFNPIRVDFKGSPQPLTVDNVLNIGVCPKTLIAAMVGLQCTDLQCLSASVDRAEAYKCNHSC